MASFDPGAHRDVANVAYCCYGKTTSQPWAVFYSAIAAFGTLALLLVLERRRALPENGIFAIDFVRDVSPAALGLTATQLACIAAFVFFGCRLAGRKVSVRSANARAARARPALLPLSSSAA